MGFDRLFAWAGGALFVASLALAAWHYGVLWSDTAPFAGWAPVLVNAVIFSIFALHHSFFARPAVKSAVAAIVPERLLRSVYVWTASLLLILALIAWRDVGGEIHRAEGALRLLHLLVQLTGAWLIASAVRAIDPLELAGIRTSSTRDDLQTSGPYRLVRHPLYLGWVLIVFGTAHLTGDRLAFACISSAYLFLAVPWEERSLERVFGQVYVDYKRRVRWRIVPYLY